MQLTFAARDRLIAGEDKYSAFRNAVLVVGPACVLTHATAGISFIALQFSNSDLIRSFGEAGLAATIIALLAVLSLVPVFGVLLVRHEQRLRGEIQKRRCGRAGAARFLRLDRGADGRPSRPVQPARGGCGWRSGGRLRQPRAALPAGRSGARQAAGGGGERPSRCQTDRRQSDRRPDRIPQGRVAVCAARRCRPSPTSTRWSRSRPASATSGRSKRCGAGSPKRPAATMSRRSRNMSA